jgi:hypothetical protein
MNVVAHQAIGEQLKLEASAILRDPTQILLAISVIEKHRPPFIPPCNHVVETAVRFES